MNRFTLISQLYGHFLRLYPAAFRETFADEMQLVFDEAWAQAAQRGDTLTFCLREFAALTYAVAWERVSGASGMHGHIAEARMITRLASLLLGLFYFAVSLGGNDGSMIGLNLILMAGVLAAWRWEQRALILTLGSGLLASVVMVAAFLSLPGMAASIWLVMIPAVLFPLPFVLFGVMLTTLDRVSRSMKANIA